LIHRHLYYVLPTLETTEQPPYNYVVCSRSRVNLDYKYLVVRRSTRLPTQGGRRELRRVPKYMHSCVWQEKESWHKTLRASLRSDRLRASLWSLRSDRQQTCSMAARIVP
jgi:hypothetical protein